MEQEIEEFALALDLVADSAVRTQGGWPGWEQRRTRSLLSAAEVQIDSRRLLGLARNLSLELEMMRVSGGFAGTWSFSIETKIGPWRIDRDGKAKLQLKAGNNVLIAIPAQGFATACGDWRKQNWSGALTFDQFEAIDNVSIFGDIEARRC